MMLNTHKGIVIIFSLIVIAYVLINKKNINRFDFGLLIVSIVALSWKSSTYSHIYETSITETFADAFNTASINNIITNLQEIDKEENIDDISDKLVMYFTAFNKTSYTPNTQIWRNLVDTTTSTKGELKCESSMKFDVIPTYARSTGFALGANRLVGPFSNTLNINFKNPYTVVMAFRHGNLTNITTKSTKIELLKLFANSPNNNGLSLYIEPTSLQTTDNIQFCKLLFQYADNDPVKCIINQTDERISIEPNTLCFLFIVKTVDSIKIIYMTEKNDTQNVLAEFPVTNDGVTFSNKELFINRFNNWNANIYNFCIYNATLSEAGVSNLYTHIKALNTRHNDSAIPAVIDNYNATITSLKNLLKCPFDQDVCDTCDGITQWNDITQLVNASLKCRQAISNYCKTNPTNSLCQCWDTKSTIYNTNGCKLLRNVFESDTTKCFSGKELTAIEEKGKCAVAKVDTPAAPTKLIYDDSYTFEKVRVKYGDSYLTTSEKKKLGYATEAPKDMKVVDMYATNATNADDSTMTPAATNISSKGIDSESMSLVNQVQSIASTNNNNNGSWSLLGFLGIK